jgi:hypothetical protein
MIRKKGKGNPTSDLRIINLIEANFNFSNKIMTRMTMNYTEANNLIPKEQYGSRKNIRQLIKQLIKDWSMI